LARTCVLILTLIAAAPAAAEQHLVLDGSGYWRHYFTYAPPHVPADQVRAELDRYLDKRARRRVERQARIRARRLGKDADTWCEHVIVEAASNQYTFSDLRVELLRWLETDLPPADWMQPSFDDADWVRQRSLFKAGRQVTAAFYRARFRVPDPEAARGLRLDAVYRGGIRVFLNGAELLRGHLSPDGAAERYPAAAYHLLDGEFLASMYEQTGYRSKYWQKVNGRVLAPEFPDAFEKIRPLYTDRNRRIEHKEFRLPGHSCTVNRKGWARIQGLRDRRASAAVPARLLKKGENVLAVEVRAAPPHLLATQWEKAYLRNCTWRHVGLEAVALRGQGVPSALERRAGVQVWAADIHRRLAAPDFGGASGDRRAARIVPARNGTFAAQIAVGTDRALKELQVTVSALKGPDGALTAEVRHFVPHRIHDLRVGDRGRRLGNGFDFRVYERFLEARYSSGKVPCFDQLTGSPPEEVPAGSCRPVWISVRVPASAAPGRYRGTVSVRADGMAAVSVPLEIEVIDWRIPDAADFTTVVGLEPCPYAVAGHYKTPVWSDAHFRLLDRTFGLLAGVDNDWLNVPVLARTEFGNGDDSMVRVIRRRDGSYAVDVSVLDRYLDLVLRHCGKPKVISFTVMHAGNPGDTRMKLPPMKIPVHDEASGKTELMRVDRAMPLDRRRAFWEFLSTTLHAHMRRRGLADVMYWGYTWDGAGVAPEMYEMLAEFVPGVGWTKGSHKRPPDRFNRAVATAYSSHVAVRLDGSRCGWRNPDLWLTYPRYWGTVIDCSDYSPPFSFRMLPDRAIAAGSRGIGRMGVDYWGRSYLAGMEMNTYPVGVPNLFLLWPGEAGPEPTARFEVLREGLQETEARVFLEQAVEKLRGDAHADLRRRITKLLHDRTAETLLDPPAGTNPEAVELCSIGWQTRSRKLYRAAAEVGRTLGCDLNRTEVVCNVPARARTDIALVLRNWTDRPRRWRLAFTDAPIPVDPRTKKPDARFTEPAVSAAGWLHAKPTAGSAEPGAQRLIVTLDSSKLEPGITCRGRIRFTDAATGRTDTVPVTATVGEVMQVRGNEPAINVTAGRPAETQFTLLNVSGSPLAWRSAWGAGTAAVPWIKATPAAGTLGPGDRQQVTVRAAPPEKTRAVHKLALTVTESGGTDVQVPVTVHVLPVYEPPARRPRGTAVPLSALPPEKVTSHAEGGRRPVEHRLRFWEPSRRDQTFNIGREKKGFKGGLRVRVPHETVLDVTGRGFRAFAAEVGPPGYFSSRTMLARWGFFRLHFEVYVDGELRAHSGLMRVTDPPRLLVADVTGAKQVRLVTRVHDDTVQRHLKGCWAEPAFYRAK
jgi:hypothetical protein